ncbi:30S ribosomal protein S12 methylthiotransferase RimO [Fusobacterium sp. PH5-44]|uniref:30S ribosomal protein S12 methylthiotransferase RimO n=1 Tax=unclassified Fusobacterium TaxID=2648384 RepID=UPI003D1A5082
MKLALISLGCSKNLVDSENYLGMLVNNRDFTITRDLSEADVVIVNTCGFIGDAKEESIEAILEVAEHKKDKKDLKLIVTGCLAQRYQQDLISEIPEIDAVIGTGQVDQILGVVDNLSIGNQEIICDSLGFLPNSDTDRILTTPKHTAYIKIAEGCNRRCSYCIIPQLRGQLKSRTIEDIVSEAKKLTINGVKELNILAQETTEYGHDIYGKPALADLLRELVKLEGLQWIRIYYMYPASFTDELLELIKNEPKICKYFDIPIQHISDNILKSMARAHSSASTIKILRNIKKEIPNATLRTSIIVGFPGETEENFQELLEYIKEIEFDYIGVFKYSREENTVAHDLPNQISEDIKEARWATLMNLQREIAEKKNKKIINNTIDVMIDGISSESEYLLEGRSQSQAYDIDGKILINDGSGISGEIVKVKIEQSFDYDFIGHIVSK